MAVGTQTDDKSLAEGLRSSDHRAFRRLFESQYPSLVAYATGFSIDRAVAEDLAQEVFVRVWKNRDAIDPDRSINAMLFVMVRNLAFNHIRTKGRRKELMETMDKIDHTPADYGSHDLDRLRSRLRSWIGALPDREQEAFRLSRFSELSHREIADVMGISQGTVEKHITNALRKLRDQIKVFDPDLLKS